ncbi:hypothetical protein [Streptomyces scabiei]|uniref:hypothetical protein n=1 Tax=Streptomyces scabiei TaxID=1930 RepID=UPI001B336483|nr:MULTISPECIES: hypothetical protein [Streptomyces]MBP5892801.1 hypothetical protein [Streptomyces sp. LBUM 1481]MBP5923067.1 hypothetical protein [Streptomyces sp. LBUM 1483]MDX2686879.1 hypothetical protein [Streptomyces scabiei]MDX2753089.1 hypothetical protein [Streptomyces scabiei]MDX2807278.1 hypothetical protein [Streptomyces scabiei]
MALQVGTWDIDFRPYGWMRLRDGEGGPTVFIQFDVTGPAGRVVPEGITAENALVVLQEAVTSMQQRRFEMRSVVMQAGSDEPLSGRTWRRIPMSQIETLLSQTNAGDMLTAPCEVSPPTLQGLGEFFEATEDTAMWTYTTGSDLLRSDGAEGEPSRPLPKVEAPKGRLTDEFLRDVADAYLWFADAKQSPAPAIADMASVPVRTVHRWIYEARKRDILPPARPGRAG